MLSVPILVLALLVMAGVMNLAWIAQKRVGNSGWIDVFWTFGTGGVGAMAALLPLATSGGPSARQLVAAVIVILWSLRLGGYIAYRVATSPTEDARYARFRREWGARYQSTLYLFVMPQAAITALLCVSIMAAARRPVAGLDARDLLAFAVLIVAIAGEALADTQLAVFKRSNTKQGAVCDVGLWAWSRHPNYFFEWAGWLAWPVMALQPAAPATWLTLLAPLAMFGVLRFLTGVPPLEETMIASRGERYRAYQARTSAFFLMPPKHGA